MPNLVLANLKSPAEYDSYKKAQASHKPVSTAETADILNEWIAKAQEAISKVKSPYEDHVRGFHIIDKRDLPKKEYDKIKDIGGQYKNQEDNIIIYPRIVEPNKMAQIKRRKHAIATMRHELEHRRQYQRGVLGKSNKTGESFIVDPKGWHGRYEKGFDWLDDPLEKEAVAAELGYMFRKYGIKGSLDTDDDIEDEIKAGVYSDFLPANVKEMLLTVKDEPKIYKLFMDKIRQAYEEGETEISDERTKVKQSIVNGVKGPGCRC